MGAQIALRQVVLRPLEQLIEALAIVGRESEEQRVALPFGGGDFARIAGVDDPPFGADIRFFKLLPGGPLAGGANLPRRQHQYREKYPTKCVHQQLLIIRIKTATAENTQHAPQHPRQQHNADGRQNRQQYRMAGERKPDALEPRQMADIIDIANP